MQAIVRFMVETGGSIADAIVARTREPGPAGGRRTRQPTSSTRTWDSRRGPWGSDPKVGLSVLTGIQALVEGLRNGSLRPVIAQEFPLAEAARSHEAVMEAGHHGKVVLVP
jgi:NADPH:quinone reductase-like Zn-dependent oxidoreductase